MINIQEIVDLHEVTVERWHVQEMDNRHENDPWLNAVCRQHQFNYLLWHEEDIARSPEVSDSEIARVKRAIDGYNQKRNDWIEKVDDLITAQLHDLQIKTVNGALMNTETPGSTIDRLSILSLRLYHLNEQLNRTDVDQTHLTGVEQKIAICRLQKDELSSALQYLIDEIFAGRKRHRTYRQLKMYNDPTLNPYLYRLERKTSPQTSEVT